MPSRRWRSSSLGAQIRIGFGGINSSWGSGCREYRRHLERVATGPPGTYTRPRTSDGGGRPSSSGSFLPHPPAPAGECRKPIGRRVRPMRRYELMLLFRPDLEDDKLQSAVEKVTRAIVNAGGALTKVSPWGKRRLAYEIQHFREASYFLIHFDIAPPALRE